MNNVYAFYQKSNLKILDIVETPLDNIDPNSFIMSHLELDDKYANLTFDEIGWNKTDTLELPFGTGNQVFYFLDINNDLKLSYTIQGDSSASHNAVYGDQKNKRPYTKEQIMDMYNSDFLNYNLKNIINSNNGVTATFVLLKEMNLRIRMTSKGWKSFYSDPYLDDSAEDKLVLAKLIKENGTFYPIITSKLYHGNDKSYVLEGNHRVISLLLLQAEGELPDDFKLLCIDFPLTKEEIYGSLMYGLMPDPVPIRKVYESIFSSEVLVDKELDERIRKSLDSSMTFINDYTIETVAKTWMELFYGLDFYPHWLRDLFYMNNITKGSDIINKEEVFKEWRKQ